MMVQTENHQNRQKLEELKKLINDDLYLAGAIQRIAQVLSEELLEEQSRGAVHGRKRQRWI
ncbi:hypothetical protein [Gracilinema caldarium]|uniref:Uncharacterized protein n=1 Tax=Gracilinema caldarium (strain ATCC 51460 / DSM 7334 / H1) TaxID=744872 RepID=F8EYR7_GRAC1|nr:hypothetical protein [Gracilinema caldarium]AEJ18644.1 hypothetical protein Spica_0480 [Gracilinema caldarium DSM 7334]